MLMYLLTIKFISMLFTERTKSSAEKMVGAAQSYDLSVHYHLGKANEVVDVLRLLSIASVSHIDDEKKYRVKEVHQFVRLGVRLVDIPNRVVSFHSSFESSFIVDFKAKKHLGSVLMDLNNSVLSKLNESFSLGEDGVFRYQSRLYAKY